MGKRDGVIMSNSEQYIALIDYLDYERENAIKRKSLDVASFYEDMVSNCQILMKSDIPYPFPKPKQPQIPEQPKEEDKQTLLDKIQQLIDQLQTMKARLEGSIK